MSKTKLSKWIKYKPEDKASVIFAAVSKSIYDVMPTHGKYAGKNIEGKMQRGLDKYFLILAK